MENNCDHTSLQNGFATRAIHAGQNPEQWDSRCIIPPIVLSSTYKQFSPAVYVCINYYVLRYTSFSNLYTLRAENF